MFGDDHAMGDVAEAVCVFARDRLTSSVAHEQWVLRMPAGAGCLRASSTMSAERLVIFGAGEGGRRGLAALRRDQVAVALCDNNTSLRGSRLHGFRVLGPEQLAEVDYDRVLVASAHFEAIFGQLVDLGIPPRAIDVLAPDILEGRETHQTPSRSALACSSASIGMLILLAAYGLWHLVLG